MAGSTTNVYPNLVDWARMTDPQGTIADIAWLLAQCNEVLKDMIWQEGNLPLGHKISANVGLPQGVWRGNNQGVPSSKPVRKTPFGFDDTMMPAPRAMSGLLSGVSGCSVTFRLRHAPSSVVRQCRGQDLNL